MIIHVTFYSTFLLLCRYIKFQGKNEGSHSEQMTMNNQWPLCFSSQLWIILNFPLTTFSILFVKIVIMLNKELLCLPFTRKQYVYSSTLWQPYLFGILKRVKQSSPCLFRNEAVGFFRQRYIPVGSNPSLAAAGFPICIFLNSCTLISMCCWRGREVSCALHESVCCYTYALLSFVYHTNVCDLKM